MSVPLAVAFRLLVIPALFMFTRLRYLSVAGGTETCRPLLRCLVFLNCASVLKFRFLQATYQLQ